MWQRLAVFVALTCALVSCCRTDTARVIEPDQVERLADATAVLVKRIDPIHIRSYCTAVWLSDSLLVTAEHCARSGAETDIEVLAEEVGEAPKPDVVGREIMFLTYANFRGGKGIDDFSDGYKARIVAVDDNTDLALVRAFEVTDHTVAPIAASSPSTGEMCHTMGHTISQLWSYSPAVVGAIRPGMRGTGNHRGMYIQVVTGANLGNSGGGLFSGNGELYGIVSFLIEGTSLVFVIDSRHIKDLMRKL